jgi:hypothetical protein
MFSEEKASKEKKGRESHRSFISFPTDSALDYTLSICVYVNSRKPETTAEGNVPFIIKSTLTDNLREVGDGIQNGKRKTN